MFVIGRTYHRPDLQEQFGGNPRGGISTPARHPLVMLYTGEQGAQYGYHDRFHSDGNFWYTGEGRRGPMQMKRGNRAILNHESNGKGLHLFEYIKPPRVVYIGEMRYVGHHIEERPDQDKALRSAIVFELAFVSSRSAPSQPVAPEPPRRLANERSLWLRPLAELRTAAVAREAPAPAKSTKRTAKVYPRSQAVRVYVIRRANGTCESCMMPAPFRTPADTPYLEPHHIRRLADEGPDDPAWMIALCPNCHRRVHHGADGEEFNNKLALRAQELEGRVGYGSRS